MKKNNSESFNSITILVTPWEKGFKCGIITTDDMFEMTDEQYELCTTIAKGMCYAANQNPDKIFKLGIKASLEQKKHEKVQKTMIGRRHRLMPGGEGREGTKD